MNSRFLLSLARRSGGLRWRTRITVWLAAAFAGLIVVLFARASEVALLAFRQVHGGRIWVPFVLTPSVAMLVVWMTNRWFSGAQGSGIPQVIAAARLARGGKLTNGLVSMRIALGKVSMVALGLLGGFSIGREGPSVQVAASILNAAHRHLPQSHSRAVRRSDLILAGGAAGVAAAFNTPLAGIMFAIEELGRRQGEANASGILLITVILSGLVAIGFEGNYTYFGHLDIGDVARGIFVPVLLIALICGTLGGVFSRLLLMPQRHRSWWVWRFRRKRPVIFAGVCGVVIATIGWISGGYSFGSGYVATANAISGHTTLHWSAPFTKFAATIVSYFSGIPGGIFAPALAIGAAVGFDLAPLTAPFANQHQVVALCMAAFLAAVTQAPITAAIIVMEMIDGHDMVLSLMGVSLLAKAISSMFGPELYQQMARGFLDGHIDRPAPIRGNESATARVP